MANIVVERSFDPPLTMEEIQDMDARIKRCLEIYRVRWIRSFLANDRRRMICEYEAPDTASVKSVQREAEARFDRVWPADVLGES